MLSMMSAPTHAGGHNHAGYTAMEHHGHASGEQLDCLPLSGSYGEVPWLALYPNYLTGAPGVFEKNRASRCPSLAQAQKEFFYLLPTRLGKSSAFADPREPAFFQNAQRASVVFRGTSV